MAGKKEILMIVTSHGQIVERHPTGIWLEEVTIPYLLFRQAGFGVTIASPLDGEAPIDPRSLPSETKTQEWAEPLTRLKHTAFLQDMMAEDFGAVFLPGGHGTMFDLPHNKDVQRLLGEMAETGKIIAAVCHGPAGLVNVRLADGMPLVADRSVTAFTNEEEAEIKLDSLMPFLLETKLREAGAHFIAAPTWSDHVEVDGNLITGQNPQSSASTARAVIELFKST